MDFSDWHQDRRLQELEREQKRQSDYQSQKYHSQIKKSKKNQQELGYLTKTVLATLLVLEEKNLIQREELIQKLEDLEEMDINEDGSVDIEDLLFLMGSSKEDLHQEPYRKIRTRFLNRLLRKKNMNK